MPATSKRCPACWSTVDRDESRCPQCDARLQPKQRAGSFLVVALAVIGIGLVVFFNLPGRGGAPGAKDGEDTARVAESEAGREPPPQTALTAAKPDATAGASTTPFAMARAGTVASKTPTTRTPSSARGWAALRRIIRIARAAD